MRKIGLSQAARPLSHFRRILLSVSHTLEGCSCLGTFPYFTLFAMTLHAARTFSYRFQLKSPISLSLFRPAKQPQAACLNLTFCTVPSLSLVSDSPVPPSQYTSPMLAGIWCGFSLCVWHSQLRVHVLLVKHRARPHLQDIHAFLHLDLGRLEILPKQFVVRRWDSQELHASLPQVADLSWNREREGQLVCSTCISRWSRKEVAGSLS